MNWFEDPLSFIKSPTLKHRLLFAAICVVPGVIVMVWGFSALF